MQKFEPDGDLITEWGETGGGPGQFIFAEGIDVDADGNVYVADTSNRRIQQFDNDGNFILQFAKNQVTTPVDVAVGSFFIVERGTAAVQRWGRAEPTPADTATQTPTATRTPLNPTAPAATPTLTPEPGKCVGDCDTDGTVGVSELIIGVNIALGLQTVDNCLVFDGDDDGVVAVNELIIGVNNALGGCT